MKLVLYNHEGEEEFTVFNAFWQTPPPEYRVPVATPAYPFSIAETLSGKPSIKTRTFKLTGIREELVPGSNEKMITEAVYFEEEAPA